METSGHRHVEAHIPHQDAHERGKWLHSCTVCMFVFNRRCKVQASLLGVGGAWVMDVLVGGTGEGFRQLCDILGGEERGFRL